MAEPEPISTMKQSRLQQLGVPNLKIAGLQIWVHGRERAESYDDSDGNWLMATSHCGESGASVWVSGAILMVTDLGSGLITRR